MKGVGGEGRSRGRRHGADVRETVCARLAAGESLLAICADPAMPGRTTVMRWVRQDGAFRARYRTARTRQRKARAAMGLPALPRRYDPAMGEAVCTRLAAGEALGAICADPAMPGLRTVYHWLERFPAFRAAYARARNHQSHALADEVLTTLRREDLPPADKQARIKGLTWMAGRLAPVKYGEDFETEADGGAAGGDVALITIVQNVVKHGGWEGSGGD